MEHKRKFDEAIKKEEKDFRLLTDKNQLNDYINRIIAITTSVGYKKTPNDYRLLKMYNVTILDGVQRLIKKKSGTYYISTEEIFPFIDQAHRQTCHGGERRTYLKIKDTVANVTYRQVHLYIELCIICEKKRSKTKNNPRGAIRPLISSKFGERAQMDLIDMRNIGKSEYNYIFHYQDHFTKFSLLEPLKFKRAADIVHLLHKIFSIFGAPKILQSDNGCEFSTSSTISKSWPNVQLVRGAPRHPQSQGSVERANGDIENMLKSCIAEHNEDISDTDWIIYLNRVQFAKNIVYHRVIGMSPYKAVFGQDPLVLMRV